MLTAEKKPLQTPPENNRVTSEEDGRERDEGGRREAGRLGREVDEEMTGASDTSHEDNMGNLFEGLFSAGLLRWCLISLIISRCPVP